MNPDISSSELEADEIKSCCATMYESDLVKVLLGESYHPGGLALTRKLINAANVRPGSYVLDVASGPGTTTSVLAQDFSARVVGVDLGELTIAKAKEKAEAAGLSNRVEFIVGDAEKLPLESSIFDVAVCECAFCTFPDKQTAANEMARVLKPGGRVALSDIVLEQDKIGNSLKTLAGWVACLADARPQEQYVKYLEKAGLTVKTVERHDYALSEMIDAIEARITALKMVNQLPTDLDIELTNQMILEARQAIDQAAAGYVTILATK